MLRSTLRAGLYGYVIQGYIDLFLAGTGLDIEARARSGVFRMSKDDWKRFDEVQWRRAREAAKQESAARLEEISRKQGVTVEQLRQQQQKEWETTPAKRQREFIPAK